jgi:segregation and condensation protein B
MQQMEKSKDSINLAAALECLLFLAEEPLPEAELARMLEVTPSQVEEIVGELARQCEGRGLQVARIAGGWQLKTRPEYAAYISRLHEPEKVRLSRAALETLAIIAYRQPITRPEIEAIRGVNVDGVVSTLLTHGLIEEKGRKEAPGRPLLYATTREFLAHFGIDKLEDLPELPAADVPDASLIAQAASEVKVGEESTAEDMQNPNAPSEEKSSE